jgi:ribosome maturation factor RimP
MNWQAAIERTVTGLGYDLVDVERSARGLLRVFIDRLPNDPTGEFITVDDCEKVTRQLQHVLEVEGGSYERLEVSSPGLDRPLKKAADYARFAGEQIELTLKMPFQGRKKYTGVLQAAQVAQGGEGQEPSAGWRIVFNDGKTDQALDFSLEEVREARLVPVIDFKGRRFAPAPNEPGDAPQADEEVGGQEQ